MSSLVIAGFFKDWSLPPMANLEFGGVRTGTKKEKRERKRERGNPSSSCFRISEWRGNINSILCGL